MMTAWTAVAFSPNSEVAVAQPSGSTGNLPVPSGDSPLGTGRRTNFSRRLFPVSATFPFRPASGRTAQASRLCYPNLVRNAG